LQSHRGTPTKCERRRRPQKLCWLVVSNMNFIFHFIYGIIPTPLTNTVFFKMVRTTNQKAMAKVQKQHESLSDPTKLMLEPSRRGQQNGNDFQRFDVNLPFLESNCLFFNEII
jgi:hypothetical protein